jgi:L-ascorbate metabolism protein UlaG (beta-lactamase superfamily)
VKLTKYTHACFTVEKNGASIVVDPGGFSTDLVIPENVVAVIVTHVHADHTDKTQLQAIIDKNPRAVIIGHDQVVDAVAPLPTASVATGETVQVAPFTLSFFGGEHALIHQSIPRIANLGVLINDAIYYPGDSFAPPNVAVDTLALPTSAPWLKMSEVMDFLVEVHPRFAFSTHDALWTDAGKRIVDRLLGGYAQTNGIEYRRLAETESIEL